MYNFDSLDWECRLSSNLAALAKTQDKFLHDYWSANGFPTKHSYNGVDETPFPEVDYCNVYESALHDRSSEGKDYYRPLVEALAPVRAILRSHPAFARILKLELGPESVRVGINNGETYTSFAQILSGLMAHQHNQASKTFQTTAHELNSLLSLSARHTTSPLENNLDLGLDIDLYYGARISERCELGGGYFIAPFEDFRDFLNPDWFSDRAPDQVRARNLDLFFGIAAPFRWTPEISHTHAPLREMRPRDVPLLFHRVAAEFSELLSVVLEKPITWVYDFPGAVSKKSCQLLGQTHDSSSFRAGEFVGHFHDPFRKQVPADPNQLLYAVKLFSKKGKTRYAEIATLLHRYAEAQRTFGRFAKEDRVLDLAIIFERYFSEKGTYKKKLSQNISKALGKSSAEETRIAEDIKQFYSLRNAIVHGAKNDGDEKLLSQIDATLKNGFKYARALLLQSIE